LVEPTSEARYRIQLNASSSLKEKLDQARALISHSNPSGDIAVVIERALDLLIEKVEKRRFGKTDRPRGARGARALSEDAARDNQAAPVDAGKRPASMEMDVPGGRVDRKREESFVQAKSLNLAARRARRKLGAKRAGLLRRAKAAERTREHIPNATRREVVARDGMRCTFVCANGCRCEARAFLQIHHDDPWARGGGPELENLRLLCAAHNQLLAEQDFGSEQLAAQVAARRAQEAKSTNAGE
jgi:hypothetical protein